MLDFARLIVHNHQETLALLHGNLDGLLQALVSTLDGNPVYHHFDVMGLVAVDLHALLDFLYLTVDTDMQVALLAHRLEQLAIVTLTTMNQRRQNQYLASGVVILNHVDNLLLGIFYHRLAGLVAVCLASTGKKQTHIVVDLGGCAHSGTGILVGCLLFDADDWR